VHSAGRCSTEYREESRLPGRRALKKRRPLMAEWVLYCKTPKATNPPMRPRVPTVLMIDWRGISVRGVINDHIGGVQRASR
jgi:hypothetical protein